MNGFYPPIPREGTWHQRRYLVLLAFVGLQATIAIPIMSFSIPGFLSQKLRSNAFNTLGEPMPNSKPADALYRSMTRSGIKKIGLDLVRSNRSWLGCGDTSLPVSCQPWPL